ncbi:MAG: hypothetical protein DRO07_00315 [Candidatus Iainarchaeum archaeon]|uniref:Uncharacterized protein n=1 Tax=Candidatus Iainarchaeum sp. TaxID=3101447 RepID=A0A497JII3_9ARCH|nr:MAG: hypothetical protein DRO07_00315 [Candidatus Diapherotrites archaeon]
MLATEERGQAYLLIGILLAGFVFVAIYSARMATGISRFGTFEIENLKRELPIAYTTGIYLNDLNYVMTHTSEELKEFYLEKRLTLKLLFTAYDENGHYILGNYWGRDCSYSTSAISGIVKNNSTTTINKETLLNDYSLTFCGKSFNLQNKFYYYAELHRGAEVIKK